MGERCAIYLRVSKSDGSQSTANQRPEVEQLVAARGHRIVQVYEEQASAVKARPVYEQMLRDAKRGGRFSVLAIWAIDRLGRSMVGNLQDILELDRVGVQVLSVKEAWMDTTGPVRNLLIAVFSWCAEAERARLVARTRLGLEAARRRGIQLGRPRAEIDPRRLRELREQGWPVRRIAAELSVGASTVVRHLQGLDAGDGSLTSAQRVGPHL